MRNSQAQGRHLTSILASARSGALDHAWREFKAAGFGPDDPNPAVHTLHGRLLKDQALRTCGEDRQRLFGEAADAYARADALAAIVAEQARPGDMVVCLGAGDITKWAAGLADAVKAVRG